jgi:hypothetical protein
MKQTKPAPTAAKKTVAPPAGIGTLFEKGNLMMMLLGVVLIILGFILMSGGHSSDPNIFNPNQVYSTVRITIAPIVILAGLAVEIVAILRNPKKS